jgi:hypothetical protein
MTGHVKKNSVGQLILRKGISTQQHIVRTTYNTTITMHAHQPLPRAMQLLSLPSSSTTLCLCCWWTLSVCLSVSGHTLFACKLRCAQSEQDQTTREFVLSSVTIFKQGNSLFLVHHYWLVLCSWNIMPHKSSLIEKYCRDSIIISIIKSENKNFWNVLLLLNKTGRGGL